MLIYFFTWLYFTFCSIIEIKFKKDPKFNNIIKILLIVAVSGLILQIGLRWDMATDWEPYKLFFTLQSYEEFFSSELKFEIGYVYLNRISLLISEDYSLFLIIHAAIFFILLTLGLKKYTIYPTLALFIYISIFYGMTGSNRQLLAVCIGFYGTTFLLKNNWKKFLLCVFIAFLFHNSALLLLIYLLLNREFKRYQIIVFLIVCFIIGSTNLPTILFSYTAGLNELAAEKVDLYDNSSADEIKGSVIGLIKRFFLVTIFLYVKPLLEKKIINSAIVLNGFMISIGFFFLFKSVSIVGGRGLLYFNIMEPLLMVYLLQLVPKNLRFSLLLLYSIICILYFFQSFNIYPELFIPYKSI